MEPETTIPESLRQQRDASRAEFWDLRIAEGVMPWDCGGVPRQLAHWIGNAPTPARVVIPGCGSAYEAVAFANAGWGVTAIDFSAEAIAIARQQIGTAKVELREEDVFTSPVQEVPVELVYERAFLAAIPPALRSAYAQWVTRQVRPGGLLVGYFLLGESRRGPPFPISEAELEALLSPAFDCIDRQPVSDSLAVFQGQDQWQVWKRREVECD
ncbi:methyltransferase domain-containing protein [Aestuariirhabdus litorea]|uniref:Methyltransferase domain-containing protein n=1 Tax=Aestuariirhabdus litorea TaxID=2528527 RepID=A0A3P3VSM0_9GAMM|nr:methyltransferase domain-containing protein [Aestuariirhabdus litorea]RRJ85317.1 methyltransferase domain-containing protein [Aestuariirhabdus litorea]RWW98539.1 methyltransferase domain-containing protein [Endozoicomonadaceae bacterium GTF-13]